MQDSYEPNQSIKFEAMDQAPTCLQQIIIAQRDEPDQKNYVYKLRCQDNKEGEDEHFIEKFFQIRVKSIEFF